MKVADADTLLVTAADKTHNARAIATDIQSIGDEIWKRFNKETNQELILWYYNSILDVLSEAGMRPTLLNPLRSAISDIEDSISIIKEGQDESD